MADCTPELLFRVWDEQSNGLNSRTLFAPAGTANDLVNIEVASDRGQQLKDALLGKAVPANHFVFFTSSLLFAFQYAAYIKSRENRDFQIACIITKTAKTRQGDVVNFRSADTLMKTWGVALRNKSSGALRRYSGEWVAMSTVVPGEGSLFTSIHNLISNGLYRLYPAFEEVNRRTHGAKWYRAIADLRTHWFTEEHALSSDKINCAAKLALCFASSASYGSRSSQEKTIVQIIACLLGFEKRSNGDRALQTWIQKNCFLQKTSVTCTEGQISTAVEVPEFQQYVELSKLFVGKKLHANVLQSASMVSPAVDQQEISKWTAWKDQKLSEHRETRSRSDDHQRRPKRHNRPNTLKKGHEKRQRYSMRDGNGSDRYQRRQRPHNRSRSPTRALERRRRYDVQGRYRDRASS